MLSVVPGPLQWNGHVRRMFVNPDRSLSLEKPAPVQPECHAMSTETTTYLRHPAEGDHPARFYEVTVRGKKLTVRYGRVGHAGRTRTKTLDKPSDARQEAEWRIKRRLA